MNAWSRILVLVRYWMKGRFTRTAAIWMAIGEVFSIFVVLFGGGTFLSFSSRFNLGSGLSYVGLSLLFAFTLVGLVQSGFNGSGLPVSSADADYVLTSPVKPREVFAAKVLMNSFTTVSLSFPPILTLYLLLARSYGTSFLAALLAGLITLAFFVICLFFSADITLSLNSTLGARLKVLRNLLLVSIAAVSLAPIALLIPDAPSILGQLSQVLPSGLAARVSFLLVIGSPWTLGDLVEVAALGAWFAALLALGIRMSRRNFYEVVQLGDQAAGEAALKGAASRSHLETVGRSVWWVVRAKERVLMSRTKETRSLLINALFLAGFMVIYALSGVFLSSPTSFLFLLFFIGSFGSGNATRWLEKERLWLIKTSALDLRRYVGQVYRARVTPLLLVLSPVAAGVGAPLLVQRVTDTWTLVSIGLSLAGALEVAALMMAGGMYFAARYGQSSTDDTLTSQGQDMADIRRFLYQTLISLALVAPLMGLVLVASPLATISGHSSAAVLPLTGVGLGAIGVGYSIGMLRFVIGTAGRSLEKREDL